MTTFTLSPEQISQLSSEYLTNGVYQDSFAIKQIAIDDKQLEAIIDMTSCGVSKTDRDGYHLTAPTIFRFLGQLLVIHGQIYFDLGETKTVEVWVKEHTIKHRKPIRDTNHIPVACAIRGVRAAHSNPEMVGIIYEITVADGAVLGEATAFFDLSRFPAALAKLALS